MIITHANIQALINYLQSHQKEAQLLAEALRITNSGRSTGDDSSNSHGFIKKSTSAEGTRPGRWLTLREVAQRVGVRSSGWVRARLHAVDTELKRQQPKGVNQWFVHEDAVPQLIDIRLQRNK